MSSARILHHAYERETSVGRMRLDAGWSELERAIVMTVAYADVFDFPLTSAEIQRYLAGVAAPLAAVEASLAGPALDEALGRDGGLVMLRGREAIAAVRERRAAVAARLWPEATRYGRLIARLPFVRMVAVTGALAVDNVEADADIDYLVVTEPGRLWLCRAAIIVLVRLAARRGVILCPNYLLSERALALEERSLYGAHELAHMVPLVGLPIYHRMRRANAWADALLPNAAGAPRPLPPPALRGRRAQMAAEAILRTRPGGWLERWEMERKIRKFSARHAGNPEISLNPDCCKGHVDRHRQRTLAAFENRLRSIDPAAQ